MHWLDPDHLPEISGQFERILLNPHGDADGIILRDGTESHFPPHLSRRPVIDDGLAIRGFDSDCGDHIGTAREAEHVADLFFPGRKLAVRGDGLKSEIGTVIEAREIGSSAASFRPLKHKKPKPEASRNRNAASPAA